MTSTFRYAASCSFSQAIATGTTAVDPAAVNVPSCSHSAAARLAVSNRDDALISFIVLRIYLYL